MLSLAVVQLPSFLVLLLLYCAYHRSSILQDAPKSRWNLTLALGEALLASAWLSIKMKRIPSKK